MIEIDARIEGQEISVITDTGVVYGIITEIAREDMGANRTPPFSWPGEDTFRDRINNPPSMDAWVQFVKHRLDGPALINSRDEYWFYKGYIVGRKSFGYTQEQFQKELLKFKLTQIIET